MRGLVRDFQPTLIAAIVVAGIGWSLHAGRDDRTMAPGGADGPKFDPWKMVTGRIDDSTDALWVLNTDNPSGVPKLIAYYLDNKKWLRVAAIRDVSWDPQADFFGEQKPTSREIRDALKGRKGGGGDGGDDGNGKDGGKGIREGGGAPPDDAGKGK